MPPFTKRWSMLLWTWAIHVLQTFAWFRVQQLLLRCADIRTPVTEDLLCKVSPWALRTITSHPQSLPPISDLFTLCIFSLTVSWNCFNVQLSLWLFPLYKWRSNISEIDKIIIVRSLCYVMSLLVALIFIWDVIVGNRKFLNCEWDNNYLDLLLYFLKYKFSFYSPLMNVCSIVKPTTNSQAASHRDDISQWNMKSNHRG